MKIKQFIKKFFLIDDTPQKVAGGAALGMFMGIFPGEGVLSTLFFSTIFRLNRLAAVASILFFNMWTTLLFFPPSVAVGSFLFRKNYSDLTNQFNQIHQTNTIKETLLISLSIFSKSAIPVLTGYLITAGSASIGFYFLLLFILKRRNIKHLSQNLK
jgi:uncharacterized protein (DUF2062 family)